MNESMPAQEAFEFNEKTEIELIAEFEELYGKVILSDITKNPLENNRTNYNIINNFLTKLRNYAYSSNNSTAFKERFKNPNDLLAKKLEEAIQLSSSYLVFLNSVNSTNEKIEQLSISDIINTYTKNFAGISNINNT
jgi:hypothetical protein